MKRLGPVFLLLILAVIWGSSFLMIKKGVAEIPPFTFALLRVGITGLLFVPVVIKYRRRINWSLWPRYLLVGCFGSLFPFIFYAIAQTQVSSNLGGMINSLTPIFALAIGIIFFKLQTSKKQLLGTFLGFFGALILILFQFNSGSHISFGATLLMVLSTICYGLNVNVVQYKLKEINPIDIASVSFTMVSIPCFIVLFIQADIFSIMKYSVSSDVWVWVSLLIVFGTFLATILYFRITQVTDAVFASSVTFLMPLVAIFWGVLDGESLEQIQILGLAITLIGVYFTRKATPTLIAEKIFKK